MTTMLENLNEAQIKTWFAAGDLNSILSFISALKDQRDRAELQTRAYMHQIQEFSKRTKAILDPILERPTTNLSTNTPTLKPKTQKPILDIAIDL